MPRLCLLLIACLAIGCGTTMEEGPPVATLEAASLGSAGDALRFSDGEIVSAGGDLALFLAVQLSLQPPDNSSPIFCEKGTFDRLADVPTDEADCTWASRLFLSGATVHEAESSSVIGLGALVRSTQDSTLYRIRILGDSVRLNDEGSLGIANVSFEYEPVP